MWQGIEGHDHIVSYFRRVLASGRLASSYFFVGAEGVGKRTFALALAKSLLCTETTDEQLQPCTQCESCRLFTAGNHPDLDVVGLPPGKRELPISLFLGERENRHQEGLCHNIGLRPKMSQRRIAIIDDADGLNTESANCLLKTLEEPPPRAVLILIGTSLSRQLPTILSRTQVVRFNPLPREVVSRVLIEQSIAETPEIADRLSAESGGSLQRAADNIAMTLDDHRTRLDKQLAAVKLNGSQLADVVNDFIGEAGTEAEAKRKRFRATLHLVTEHFSQQLRDPQGIKSTNRASDSRLLSVLERCLLAEEELDRNANIATLVECWVDDLARELNSRSATR